jgi:hypothetical protein
MKNTFEENKNLFNFKYLMTLLAFFKVNKLFVQFKQIIFFN